MSSQSNSVGIIQNIWRYAVKPMAGYWATAAMP